MLPTAMIVDDNREMRETLKSLLTDCASVIDECTDGDEVLEHYRSSHPDIVLMDIAMKNVDGLRAAQLLMQECPEARIVMVSNYDDEEMRSEAMKAGSIGYVHKEYLGEVRQFFL